MTHPYLHPAEHLAELLTPDDRQLIRAAHSAVFCTASSTLLHPYDYAAGYLLIRYVREQLTPAKAAEDSAEQQKPFAAARQAYLAAQNRERTYQLTGERPDRRSLVDGLLAKLSTDQST